MFCMWNFLKCRRCCAFATKLWRFLHSKCTVGINGTHQPSPSICDHLLFALLTLGPNACNTSPKKKFHSSLCHCFLFDAVYWRCAVLFHLITVVDGMPTAMHAFYLHCNQQNPMNPQKEKDLLLLPHFSWIHCLQNKKESTFCSPKWEISWFWWRSFAPSFKLNGSVTCSGKTRTLESALNFENCF